MQFQLTTWWLPGRRVSTGLISQPGWTQATSSCTAMSETQKEAAPSQRSLRCLCCRGGVRFIALITSGCCLSAPGPWWQLAGWKGMVPTRCHSARSSSRPGGAGVQVNLRNTLRCFFPMSPRPPRAATACGDSCPLPAHPLLSGTPPRTTTLSWNSPPSFCDWQKGTKKTRSYYLQTGMKVIKENNCHDSGLRITQEERA